MKKYVVIIDEGTTSTRVVLYDFVKKQIEKISALDISQFYPNGYVEQDGNEIYAKTYSLLIEMLGSVNPLEVLSISITNQRETIIPFDKVTGDCVSHAIVWQCKRTAPYMLDIEKKYKSIIKEKTGLVCDSYFSASKMAWLLKNDEKVKRLFEQGRLYLGTVDSYLSYMLSNKKSFVTDTTNASRTMLFNINTLSYDEELLSIFGIDKSVLPSVIASDETYGFFDYNGEKIPLCGIIGDQQSALLGQGCIEKGDGKATYGTGLFMLVNTGKEKDDGEGLLTDVAYTLNGETAYALEGSAFNCGSAIKWLKNEMGLISCESETERLSQSIEDSGGVYFVPAFNGLGAPYWDSNARATFSGIGRDSTRAHIVRAVLESLAYTALDLCELMEKSGGKMTCLKVDGGATKNDFLMGFQADILGFSVDRAKEKESTAQGAGFVSLIGQKVISLSDVKSLRESDKIFKPTMNKSKRDELVLGYRKAIEKTLLH